MKKEDVKIGRLYLVILDDKEYVVKVNDKGSRYVEIEFSPSSTYCDGGYYYHRLLRELSESEVILEMLE